MCLGVSQQNEWESTRARGCRRTLSCVFVLDRYTSWGPTSRNFPTAVRVRSQWVSVSPMFRRRQPADADAFGAEVLRYLEPLYATALRLTRNRADAEDLVQDTLVKAFRFSDKFERGTNLRAWLSTILHNTWRNRVRDAGREAVEVDSTRLEEAEAAADGSSGRTRRPSNSCSGTRWTETSALHSTSCRTYFGRRSGCVTSRSSRTRRSRRCSMCQSEP